uniref:Uncharacterized protein n=1 Tax=Erythrolobus madagascarensis TaxID=708628 RepID=A0A7S0XJK1_9RHOD
MGVAECKPWMVSPVVDGNTVRELLPGVPAGPEMRRVMDTQLEWMLEQPQLSKHDVQTRLVQHFSTYVHAPGQDTIRTNAPTASAAALRSAKRGICFFSK